MTSFSNVSKTKSSVSTSNRIIHHQMSPFHPIITEFTMITIIFSHNPPPVQQTFDPKYKAKRFLVGQRGGFFDPPKMFPPKKQGFMTEDYSDDTNWLNVYVTHENDTKECGFCVVFVWFI